MEVNFRVWIRNLAIILLLPINIILSVMVLTDIHFVLSNADSSVPMSPILYIPIVALILLTISLIMWVIEKKLIKLKKINISYGN